ncbi:DUF3576 domain-containing protein [Candidatus Pelagibacter sp.]|jgi:hypothetical protein|nr:DUF3576 domain-containing protein [Candidatus Pelagibacter sp.]|tara:strand:- start:303 stop:902 length:600 start_codon:yes stop_codon:yes gene_type:complete
MVINNNNMIKKNKYSFFSKNLILSIFLFFFITSCGFYKKSDARKVSPDPKQRVKDNMEKGKGFRIKDLAKGDGNFQFASSNEMWRATLDVLDFAPLGNVDYSGGLIITDWFSEVTEPGNSLKVTVRFLTTEIRADGLNVTLHKKTCNKNLECNVKKYKSKTSNQIKLAILKRATIISKMDQEKYLEENGKVRVNENPKF